MPKIAGSEIAQGCFRNSFQIALITLNILDTPKFLPLGPSKLSNSVNYQNQYLFKIILNNITLRFLATIVNVERTIDLHYKLS